MSLKTTRIITTKADLEDFVSKVLASSETYIAVDTETSAFDSKKGKTLAMDLNLYGVGFYLNKDVHAYVVYGMPEILRLKELQAIFDAKECIFHNAKFDLQILDKHGFNISKMKIHDTMILSWLDDEDKLSHGLKQLSRSILHRKEVTEYKDVGEHPGAFGGLFPEEDKDEILAWTHKMGKYCVEDCQNTFDLFFHLEKSVKAQELWGVYTNLEIPFIFVLMEMEQRGITVDVDYLIEKEAAINVQIKELTAQIRKIAGNELPKRLEFNKIPDKLLNLDSPLQLRELFKKMKISVPDEFKTPTGEVSTSVAALRNLASAGIEIAEHILKYRMLTKIRNTYLIGLREVQRNGVVYSSFNHIGTHTGRLSSSAPNLQQLPRRDDEWNIRGAFKPRPGYIFVISDFSQIELRVAAYFAQDSLMCSAFQNDHDIHYETAAALNLVCSKKCGDTENCKQCKNGRTRAKAVNFGLLYGLSAFGLSRNLAIDVNEAEKFLNQYFQQFPTLKLFIDRVTKFVRKNKYICTITRRRRHFKGYNKIPVPAGVKYSELPEIEKALLDKERIRLNRSIERMATNTVIQGSAADITKIAMKNVQKKIKDYDAYILVQIHDELIVECPIGKEYAVLDIVKYEMENALKLKNVPVKVDQKICTKWEK